MNDQVFALHDSDPVLKKRGAFAIDELDAPKLQKDGYGIFHVVNPIIKNMPRRKANLVKIEYWFVEVDGDKKKIAQKIHKGLKPTTVVETKNGYHIYFKAKDGTRESWDAIVKDRLIPFYGGDENARDYVRLLRRPGYFHLKNPNEPFLVKRVWEMCCSYSEKEMALIYPSIKKNVSAKKLHKSVVNDNPQNADFWDFVWNLNCEYALDVLSGSRYVGSETYSFKENSDGTKNIWVDGKGTSAWIDKDGRIGSTSGGGPTIAQWLHWYGIPYPEVVEIIKKEFKRD